MNRLVKNDYFENTSPRFDEIKRLLDENGFKEKMEGMKRLIAMMSKGQDVSALYPDVVKNVVCPNMTVKKLVYMYIVHYAELEPDPALLAINNFQRDMQNENQLIRALGLRVLSSIRLRVIVQVIVLAVKKACKDGSPYVRKAAAHAIPKIYTLDRDQHPDLMEVLETLLKDRATMVLGSALWAWNEICPDRLDLLHPHYRKLCRLLADIDEWGQIVILNTLTRYGRTQFANPERETPKKEKKPKENAWLDGKHSSDEEDEEEESEDDLYDGSADLDPDHRLLLQSALPLLKSRNSGVVMAVATLYYYLAPQSEISIVGKALTRLMRDSREIQYVVLSNISDMAATRPAMFSPFLHDFFVNTTDPVFIRRLKLEILTCIATETNISAILSELNFYVHLEDKDLVTASIQAIGRCATRLPEVADNCMRTLMVLISNPSEAVVAESVVVIKKLLQMGEKREFPLEDVVTHLAKLLPNVKVPKARAAIVWVIGEYHHTIPLRAPDILRSLAKSFIEEDDTVKLQVLNLGSKLMQSNPEQTTQLLQYVLDLASYDLNYDIRDRARLMRRILFSSSCPILAANAKRLFITKKPAPVVVLESDQRQRYTIGSMSHLVGHKVVGYTPISDFPAIPPETDRTSEEDLAKQPDLRDQEEPSTDTDSSLSYTDSGDDDDDRDRKEGTKGTDDESSDLDKYSDEDSQSDAGSYTDSYTDSETYSDSESDADEAHPPTSKEKEKEAAKDNFLDFGLGTGQGGTGVGNGLTGLEGLELQAGSILAPHPTTPLAAAGNSSLGTGVVLPKHQLLNQVIGGGLSIEYRFVRRPSIHGPTFNTIQLIFTNHLAQPISNIRVTNMKLPSGMQVMPFNDVSVLPPGATFETLFSISFASVTQSAKFEISTDRGSWEVSLQPILGELVKPRVMSSEEFDTQQKKLGGMQEIAAKTTVHTESLDDLTRAILEAFNLSLCVADAESGTLKLAGVTVFDDKPFLLSLAKEAGEVSFKINCENTILAAMAKSNLVKALASVGGLTEKQS